MFSMNIRGLTNNNSIHLTFSININSFLYSLCFITFKAYCVRKRSSESIS